MNEIIEIMQSINQIHKENREYCLYVFSEETKERIRNIKEYFPNLEIILVNPHLTFQNSFDKDKAYLIPKK